MPCLASEEKQKSDVTQVSCKEVSDASLASLSGNSEAVTISTHALSDATFRCQDCCKGWGATPYPLQRSVTSLSVVSSGRGGGFNAPRTGVNGHMGGHP